MRSHPQTTAIPSRGCSQHKSAEPPQPLVPYVIVAWIALAVTSYRNVLLDLLDQWHTNATYSHGPIVIPIALWLLWHRRSIVPEVSKPWITGIGLLFAAHFLLWLGGYFHLLAIQRWTIPVWLGGMIGLLWGRQVLIWSLPGVCFLAFMIPVPFQLEMLANQFLQWASAWSSCLLLGLLSTFAMTDGYTLRMATGQMWITADCSGLRMSMAMAALCYVLTFLSHERSRRVRSHGAASLGLALHLCVMVLLIMPATILANAARITVMALVMDRFRVESWTAWAHDLGEWFVLPVSVVLFLTFRAWFGNALHLWRAAIDLRRSSHGGSSRWRRWLIRNAPFLRMAITPTVLALLVGGSIWHYERQRQQIAADIITAARKHEATADWASAAACYRQLMYLQSSPEEARYKYAWVSRQAAISLADRQQILFELEAIVNRVPCHLAALRMHLDLALELDMAAAARRSAERLYSVDRHDASTLQMCVVAMLRFPTGASGLPALSAEPLNELFANFGPVAQWRDDLVIELAAFCCQHPNSVDQLLTSTVGSVITQTSNRIGSAKAQFASWQFERAYAKRAASLEVALSCIDNECPNPVAYQIYLAAAQEALSGCKLDDAKQYLRQAIDRIPTDHRGYALLGDVHRARRDWSPCAAAYLRAWRLAGDRPLELGIKLAESLLRTERHSASTELVRTLVEQLQNAIITPSSLQQMRLYLVQAQLDMRAARHDEALQKLRRCRALAAEHRPQAGAQDELLPTVEALQAQCLLCLGKYAEAARFFEGRAGRAEAPADQWTAAARAWRTAGNASAAANCYRNAILDLRCCSEVWLEYVQLLKNSAGIDEAAGEVAFRSRRVQHGFPIADEVLAQAWEIVGKSDQAIQYYRAAAHHDVRDVAALAIALARQGQGEYAVELVADEAWSVSTAIRAHTAAIVGVTAANLSSTCRATIMQIVEEGVEAANNDVTLLLAAAEWYTKCQARSAALEMLHHAVTLQPENVVAANNLAMLLADDGRDCERALGTIDNVLQRTGPVSEFLDTKGWILVQMNRADEALPWLVRAAEGSSSSDPIAQLHLAAAYMAVGDRAHARESLNAATAGQIRPAMLNTSEQSAWATLQKEFTQQAPTPGDSDA